jgi:hypothetical protein
MIFYCKKFVKALLFLMIAFVAYVFLPSADPIYTTTHVTNIVRGTPITLPNDLEMFCYFDRHTGIHSTYRVYFCKNSYIPVLFDHYNLFDWRTIVTCTKIVRWSMTLLTDQIILDWDSSMFVSEFMDLLWRHDIPYNLSVLIFILLVFFFLSVIYTIIFLLFAGLLIPLAIATAIFWSLYKYSIYVEMYFSSKEDLSFFTDLEPSVGVNHHPINFKSTYKVLFPYDFINSYNFFKKKLGFHTFFFWKIYLPVWLLFKWYFHVFWHLVLLYVYTKIIIPWFLPKRWVEFVQWRAACIKFSIVYSICQYIWSEKGFNHYLDWHAFQYNFRFFRRFCKPFFLGWLKRFIQVTLLFCVFCHFLFFFINFD